MSFLDLFPELSWGEVVYYLFLLALVYLLLWLAPLAIRRFSRPGRARQRWLNLARKALAVYEPVAIVLAIIVVVCINPVLDGLIVIGVVILGWSSIRNYIDGQVIRLTTPLRPGQEITVAGHSGAVLELNALSLLLQTEDGNRVVPYRTLRSEGFTISRGARISGVHEYLFLPTTEPAANPAYLRNLLFNCPYLDWSQHPEILKGDRDGFLIRVMLEDDKYVDGLRQLVSEWGYTVEEKL